MTGPDDENSLHAGSDRLDGSELFGKVEGWLPPDVVSAEEVAFAEELARLYPADHGDVVYAEDFGHGLGHGDGVGHGLDGGGGEGVWSAGDDAAAAVLAALSHAGGCGAAELLVLESVDPASLTDPLARIAYVQVLDRVEAAIAARRYDTVLSVVAALPDPADYAREHARTIDLAVAARSSFRAAGQLIDTARAARMVFPAMHAALAAGAVSDRHLRILVERTRVIDDAAVLTLIGEQAVALAQQLTPPRFQDALEHVIVAFDPDAPARRHRARQGRDAWSVTLPDGMRLLSVTGDAATITAIQDRINTAAHALRTARGGAAAARAGNPDATPGACRADATAALILGTPHPDGSVVLDPATTVVHLQVVIDLPTLRGERDNPALLDGTPIPAAMGRDLASYARTWRRIVTDPVTGHCLDYGRRTYLPRPLHDYVQARDARCRIPGCPTTTHLQLDHATRFPDGPSTPANTGMLSTGCHHAKTAGHLRLDNSQADGSTTLITLLGQHIHIPPRPYLGWQPPPPEHTAPAQAQAHHAPSTRTPTDLRDDEPPF